MNNLLLMVLFCFLVTYVVIATIRVDKRLILYTDTIEKHEIGKRAINFRSRTGSMYSDVIKPVNKKYLLQRTYFIFPSVLAAIERKKFKNHERGKITYFFDPVQIEQESNKYMTLYKRWPRLGRLLNLEDNSAIRHKKNKEHIYEAIAGESKGKSKKNSWYWFSLIAYVTKYSTSMFMVPVIGLVVITAGFRPENRFEIAFYWFVVFCLFVWGLVL